jgi:16S rRNA (uracil1498-N3)-methyltransferase
VNIILFDASELGASGDVRVLGARAAHLRQVLNVTPGQTVRVGLIDGPLGEGSVRVVGEDAVELRCAFEAHTPDRPRVDLLLALPRPKVMRRLWAQLAAIGVGRIILTNAERVERPYFDTHVLTPETYRPLLIEGLQQARDTRVPDVSIHRRFKVLVEDDLDRLCAGPVRRLVADPAAKNSVADLPRARADERLLLAVGPEGGWNAFEIDLLARHGFTPIGMGARTLRSDTACIALLAILTMT